MCKHLPAACRLSAVLLAATALACGDVKLWGADSPAVRREIFVPFDDLNVILQGGDQRVFLTRAEYESLRALALQQPAATAPHGSALAAAEYEATIQEGRVHIQGQLLVDIMSDELQAVPLDVRGVGLRSVTLDGQPAPISQPRDGQSLLFVQGRGRHPLRLEAVAPVEVSAAQQTVRYQLPNAAASRIRLTAPGDIELRSGAAVLDRQVDEAAGVTRMELLPGRGAIELVMSLNNRQAGKQQILLARNVLVDELTETYERLHVTSSWKILHGSVQRVRFALPAGFEITDVSTPLLSRWAVSQDGGNRILEIALRGPQTEPFVIHLTAQRSPAVLTGWTMPQLRPLEVAGSVSILGLLVEERLQVESLAAAGLVALDVQTLTAALPPSVLQAEPGALAIRPVAAYYAAQPEYGLTADLVKPPRRIQATSSTLLIAHDLGLEVRGGFALLPVADNVFSCDFSAEPGWDVTEVTLADGQSLAFQQHLQEDGQRRIHVVLSEAIPAGQTRSLLYHARAVPAGWLATWTSQDIRFPQFLLSDADGDRGALAVQARDDLVVQATATEGLTPLDEDQKAEFNLAEVPTSLAFRFDSRPVAASLHIERTPPRVTAETYSFLEIQPGRLGAHYEIIYQVNAAGTRTVAFQLPTNTPAEIAIRGLDNVAVKQFSSQETPTGRRWTVELAEPVRGKLRLEVIFQQHLAVQSTPPDPGEPLLADTVALPVVRAEDVEYQTGAVAVEGSDELETRIDTAARKVDAGELAAADYRPGRHLLATFGFADTPPDVTARVTRPPRYPVPAAAVQRAELVTSVSASGVGQTVARFHLRTKAAFVAVRLPAGASLWSAYLDSQPARPQRDGDRVLVSLPSTGLPALRDLQLVYETPIGRLGFAGEVRMPAPQLLLADSPQTAAVPVPMADLAWYLQLPTGLQPVTTAGTVSPNLQDPTTRQQLSPRPTAVQRLIETLLVSPGWAFWPAREFRMAQAPYIQSAQAPTAAPEVPALEMADEQAPPALPGPGGGVAGGGVAGPITEMESALGANQSARLRTNESLVNVGDAASAAGRGQSRSSLAATAPATPPRRQPANPHPRSLAANQALQREASCGRYAACGACRSTWPSTVNGWRFRAWGPTRSWQCGWSTGNAQPCWPGRLAGWYC